MTPDEIQYWRDSIDARKKWMKPKWEMWRRLIRAYKMHFDIPGLEDAATVPVSRFYPLVRQIVASVAFNYPKVFFRIEEESYENVSDILERAANEALTLMEAKPEIHQAIFDALFCFNGWLKFGYNPPGSNAVAPYVSNDSMQDDFPYVMRVNPFNILPDPLTPPHKFGHATDIIEMMWVPLEFLRSDKVVDPKDGKSRPRYDIPDDFKGTDQPEDAEDPLTGTASSDKKTSDEEREALTRTRQLKKMTLIYEIHDRIHQRRITLAEGLDNPIEDIEHPFASVEAVTQKDPVTGEPRWLGETNPLGGYIIEGGFPYFPIRFDLSDEFYGLPPMAYVEDMQNLVVESVSRRADLLKRFKRVALGNKAEKDANPNIGSTIATAKDADIVWLNDITSIRELNWGSPPADQLNIEQDARSYEEQILGVSEMARGGGKRVTATQASLAASYGQLNREWLQTAVSRAYEVTVRNALDIMADQRYTPDAFVLNIAPDGEKPVYQKAAADWFKVRYKVEIETGSMQPLVEQLERDDAIGLYDRISGRPEVDQIQALKTLFRAFRVKDPDRLLKDDVNADAVKAAMLENVAYLMSGGDPGVNPGEDHDAFIQVHMQMEQLPQFGQMPPQAQQMAVAARDKHVQAHQQMKAQESGQKAPTPGAQQEQAPASVEEAVQSNAAKTAAAVTSQARNL